MTINNDNTTINKDTITIRDMSINNDVINSYMITIRDMTIDKAMTII